MTEEQDLKKTTIDYSSTFNMIYAWFWLKNMITNKNMRQYIEIHCMRSTGNALCDILQIKSTPKHEIIQFSVKKMYAK